MSAIPPDHHRSNASAPRSRLRRLDDAVVPRLQRAARPVGRVVGLPGRLLHGLDDRFAGGRPARAVQANRGIVAFLVVGLAFGATTVHSQRYPVLQERARQAAENQGQPVDADDVVPGGDNDIGSVASVGPLLSSRVEPYLASRGQALVSAAEDADRVAVVSFDGFLQPGEAADLLDAVEVHLVQYRLPERTPRPAEVQVDDGRLVASVERELADLVAELRREEAEVASTLESDIADEEFRADYEARLDELSGLRNILTADPAVVFAAVVTGDVVDLRRLDARAPVRLVDLAPPGTPVDETTFFGILPTDQDRFSFGRRG